MASPYDMTNSQKSMADRNAERAAEEGGQYTTGDWEAVDYWYNQHLSKRNPAANTANPSALALLTFAITTALLQVRGNFVELLTLLWLPIYACVRSTHLHLTSCSATAMSLPASYPLVIITVIVKHCRYSNAVLPMLTQVFDTAGSHNRVGAGKCHPHRQHYHVLRWRHCAAAGWHVRF